MPTETFSYTGSEQTWTVPSNVTAVTLRCWGAGGGTASSTGGYAEGVLPVTPGETLRLFVGGQGGRPGGGWPTGGDGGQATAADGTTATAYGGGGATDVRQGGATLADRVIVAGGGGGEGDAGVTGAGGDGGAAATDGEDAVNSNAQAAGGVGGAAAGATGETGGTDTGGNDTYGYAAAGGGGGGGANGGGGGEGNHSSGAGVDYTAGAGGGGGDGSLSGVSSGSMTVAGGNTGNGQLEIQYVLPPSNLSATDTDYRSLTLSWDAVSGADSYNIYRDGTQIDSVSAGTTSYDDTGPLSVTTGGAAPTGVHLDATVEDELTVSWTDTTSDESGFEVHLATAAGVDTTGTPDTTTGVNVTSATITGLDDGERYYVRVVAVDADGDRGADSAEVQATTVLPAPTGLTVDAVAATTADISWTNNHDTGTVTVQYRRSSATSWTDAATGLSLAAESYTISGLLTGEQYDVRVAAVTTHETSLDSTNFDVAPGETYSFSKPLTVDGSQFSKPLDNAGTVQPTDTQ